MAEEAGPHKGMYGPYAASLAASFVVMYFLAFSQIDVPGHFHLSLSVLWITLSMVSSMGVIMLVAMKKMLPNPRVNLVVFATFAVVLLSAVGGGRTEALVGDEAFLRSMIPHHSRAIHMCQEADLEDPEIKALCEEIIATQREEIAIMERLLRDKT